MFSGAGVYADGVMFAILAEDTLYLKADEFSARAFADEGKGPFTYRPKGRGPVAMSYWEVPERLLDDPEELVDLGKARARGRARRQSQDAAAGFFGSMAAVFCCVSAEGLVGLGVG